MIFRLTLDLAAVAMLLIVPAFSQEQPAGNAQAPPSATAPQASSPQPDYPPNASPSSEKQAPPQPNAEQAAPEGKQSSTPNESAPVLQQQAPAQQQTQESRSTQATASPTKSKSSRRKTLHKRKPYAPVAAQSKSGGRAHPNTASSSGEPGKVVVRNGGAKDDVIRLSPGGTQEQEVHTRENTSQLLATTDENLKRVAGRQLTAAEKNTVDQIHSYMRQAKSAADAGDLARAHTLAFKAHLLSDDLAKR